MADGTEPQPGGQPTPPPAPAPAPPAQVDTLAIAREAKKTALGEIDEALAALGFAKPNGMSTKDFIASLAKKGSETEKAFNELKTSTEDNSAKMLNTLVRKAVGAMEWDSAHDGLKDALVTTATAQLIANHKVSVNENFEIAIEGETFADVAKKYVGAYLKTAPPESPAQTGGEKQVEKPKGQITSFKGAWYKTING